LSITRDLPAPSQDGRKKERGAPYCFLSRGGGVVNPSGIEEKRVEVLFGEKAGNPSCPEREGLSLERNKIPGYKVEGPLKLLQDPSFAGGGGKGVPNSLTH